MFYKLLNNIKLNNVKKKKILIIKLKINEVFFLKKLVKLNIIKFIFKSKDKFILILNIFKKNNLIFNIKNVYKPSNIKILKYKNIKKINKTYKLFLLTSNNGLITNYEAELKKIGGYIIAYIWN